MRIQGAQNHTDPYGSGCGYRSPKNIRIADPGGPKTYHSGTLFKTYGSMRDWRGVVAGSITRRHGSADQDPHPDSHQNIVDPEHRLDANQI
jgi:hypothetical protein